MDGGAFVDRREAENTTLAEALKRYEAQVTPTKKGSAAERRRLAAWARSALAKRSLASLKPADFAAWRDARLREVKPATVRLDLAVVSHLFKVAALDWSIPVGNPIKGIRLPKADKGRERRASDAELIAIENATESSELPAWIRLAVETAMRRGEIASLTWRAIDLDSQVARLEDTKNNERRAVPLSSSAVATLRRLPRRIDGRVFSLTPNGASQAFSRALQRARRDYEAAGGSDPDFCVGLRLHDLRHEATSRIAERGFSMLEVAAITGHKTLSCLKRYAHLRAEDLARKLG